MTEKRMENNKKSLIGILNPKPNSTIMIYDVHASESGALSILDDLYQQIRAYSDKSIKWIFVVSTPKYKESTNLVVCRFPWVKKGWLHRYWFNNVTTRQLLNKFKPDKVFSLQNEGINFYHKEQIVYLHLPFILTDYKFSIREDGIRLWVYQNIISHFIFFSLHKVKKIIVQTEWMKTALVNKAHILSDKIIILPPDVSANQIGIYEDKPETRCTFFYPATAFTYKNHMTLLKALDYAQKNGLSKYELILTICSDENKYTKALYNYACKHNLNVKFKGQISRKDVFKMYTKSVLVFPSYVESFGLPLLEAKLTGTYIISSDCPFSREILSGYNRAYYFFKTDYEQMGKLILELEEKI